MSAALVVLRRVVGLVLAVAVLAGCTTTSPVARRSATTEPSVAPGVTLSTGREEAGLVDCPVSDPDVAPVADGLPDLVLPCLGGGRDVRLAGLRGTPLVINVWAQWCQPCRKEAPVLAEVSQAYGDKVLFLGIDYTDPHPELALEWAQQAGWTYAQLSDPDQAVRIPLAVPGPPVTLLVRPDGTIAARHFVLASAAELTELITTHLGVSP